MIIGLLYSIFHLVLGLVAAVWTAKRLHRAGYIDGCFVFFAAFVAFIFYPFALAILIVDWVVDTFMEGG
jgi:hypothetical protein